jgi:hypothetical protein
MAHRVISLPRGKSVVFGPKEPLGRVFYEYTAQVDMRPKAGRSGAQRMRGACRPYGIALNAKV